MIRLYEYPPSSNCQKVRLVLAEKGLSYESVIIDLRKKEQTAPEYLRINPYGLVPAMDDDGVVIYESTIINEFLEEKYPQVPVFPQDPAARAKARILEDFRDNHLYPALKTISRLTRSVDKEDWDHTLIAAAFESMASIFERLEEELDGKDFLAGEYSIADIAFTPNLSRLVDMGVGLPDRFPRLKAWTDRMMKRPNHRSIAEYGARH